MTVQRGQGKDILQAADVHEAGERVRTLSLLDFPTLALTLDNDWLLPNGRSSLQHHLFPAPPVVRTWSFTAMKNFRAMVKHA